MDDFLIFFGGTFDPPHIGHREMLIAASKARYADFSAAA